MARDLWHSASDVDKKVHFHKENSQPPVVEERKVEGLRDKYLKVDLQRLNLSLLSLECDYSPRWIDQVKTLRCVSVLDLVQCGLTQLPPAIASMTSLRRLRLGKNHLTLLPETIQNLTQLRVLSAYANRLQSLPRGMYRLNQLRILRLGGNKLTAQHLAVLSNGLDLRLFKESLWEIHLKDNPLLVANEIPTSFSEALKEVRWRCVDKTEGNEEDMIWIQAAAELDVQNCRYR